jgi:hypothetical protein
MLVKCLGFKTPAEVLPNAVVLHLPVESGPDFERPDFLKALPPGAGFYTKLEEMYVEKDRVSLSGGLLYPFGPFMRQREGSRGGSFGCGGGGWKI